MFTSFCSLCFKYFQELPAFIGNILKILQELANYLNDVSLIEIILMHYLKYPSQTNILYWLFHNKVVTGNA